jgi:two-component system KDP operon response regulator KdpE
MRVLVVEDEAPLRRALAMNLTARGWEVSEAGTGTDALEAVAVGPPDVVILDLGLPDIDGVEVVRGIRGTSDVPIVVLSARTGSSDKVTALDLGADDYVTKPFNVDELLARLRASTRRVGATGPAVITIGSSTVDLGAKSILRTREDGSCVALHLTPTEWHLLEALLRNPNKLMTSDQLLTILRGGSEHTDPSYLRIYVASLRRKLEAEPGRPRHIITEPGMGYRYEPRSDELGRLP